MVLDFGPARVLSASATVTVVDPEYVDAVTISTESIPAALAGKIIAGEQVGTGPASRTYSVSLTQADAGLIGQTLEVFVIGADTDAASPDARRPIRIRIIPEPTAGLGVLGLLAMACTGRGMRGNGKPASA
jgi:hypothetical protein